MSLGTIIQIGNALRKSKDPMKHFRYVCEVPRETDDKHIICLTIPIDAQYHICFDNVRMSSEIERNSFYYLNYRTSNNDRSGLKYVFGDILYEVQSKVNAKTLQIKIEQEQGNYILDKSEAFNNAGKIREEILKGYLENEKFKKKDIDQFVQNYSNYLRGENIEDNVFNAIINKYPLLFLWADLYRNREKLYSLLKYAPVFEANIQTKNVEDDYIKYLFNSQYKVIKSLLHGIDDYTQLSHIDKETLINYRTHSVFIHFEFLNAESWYDQEAIFKDIIDHLNQEILIEQERNQCVMKTSLYRTLCSGNDKNDIQFPNFLFSNSYKSFSFAGKNNFYDFLYTRKITDRPRYKIGNLHIYVYPHTYQCNDISVEKYEAFFLNKESEASLFSMTWLDDVDPKIFSAFDFVISERRGQVEVNLIEISGIGYSRLVSIRNRIRDVEYNISKEKERELSYTHYTQLRFKESLCDIFGSITFKEQKDGRLAPSFSIDSNAFRKHFLKVVPQIYKECYYSDNVLLSKTIERIEFSLRSEGGKYMYKRLKYDLKLLYSIQNNQINEFMEMCESKSYLLGVKIGKIAKPLRNIISSFEKSYVGLISRHVTTKSDCVNFVNVIFQKLILHDKAYRMVCEDICNELVILPDNDYNKDYVAFGFFEGYFKYESNSKKSFKEALEQLFSDYQDDETCGDEIERLSNFVAELHLTK